MPTLRCHAQRPDAEHPREVPGVAAQGGGTVDVAASRPASSRRGLAACAAWWRSIRPRVAPDVGVPDTDDGDAATGAHARARRGRPEHRHRELGAERHERDHDRHADAHVVLGAVDELAS